MRLRNRKQGSTQTSGQSALKGARNLCKISPAHPVRNYAVKQRPKIQFFTRERKRIGFRSRRAAGQLFQPHRRLPFKRNLPGKTKERGGGVKQPSYRSRGQG